jgi:hypothetical protein
MAVAQLNQTVSGDSSFETYCLLRGMDLDLKMEDCYDFVKFMLTLQGLKQSLAAIGVPNLIPVGSAVTKTTRKEAFVIDMILNYNKTVVSDFGDMVGQIENILKEKLNEDSESYFVQANMKEGS